MIKSLEQLWACLNQEAAALGLDLIGVAPAALPQTYRDRLLVWLEAGYAAEMHFLRRWSAKRTDARTLDQGAERVILVGLAYADPMAWQGASRLLHAAERGYVARFALGRDYHKVLTAYLKALHKRLEALAPEHRGRLFVDSAPIMEIAFALEAGLGWQGKNTLLLTRKGSLFFLGGITTNLPFPLKAPGAASHCGRCRRCLEYCPTQALVAPYLLDARRCIAYLTIEHKGLIPEALRSLIGNRIFGCDDCQIVCPWNRFAPAAREPDLAPRFVWSDPLLVELIGWSEAQFRFHAAGTPLMRLGYERFLRNVAVALGNAPTTPEVVAALRRAQQAYPSPLVQEHLRWALARHGAQV